MDNENKDKTNQDTASTPNADGSAEIKEIIMRAVQEPEFKELLANDPDKALEGYELTEFQRMLITTLDADDLDKLTPENLEEYFSADSAVYTPDIEAESGEEAGEEDI